MAPRTLVAGLGLVLLACVGGLAALREKPLVATGATRPPPPAGQGERSGLRAGPTERGFLGVVTSDESVDLATRFEGRVESVRVQVGSEVHKGDVVATLDAKTRQQALAIAEAELLSRKAEQQMAELSLEEAGEKLKRREAPGQLSTGAISEEELSAARYEHRMASAKLEMTRSQVREREARVAQLRQEVEETTLRAPFDGVVAGRFAHPGALVQAGQAIVHLLHRGTPQVRFAIPAAQEHHLSVGSPVRVEVPERGVVLGGRVAQVAPEVDVASLMIFALAELEAQGTPLPAGTVVRVSAVAGQEHSARE
ncbi:efflux RND transporter periplasmic adaptor subunit [Vitiosangium sp. GDMCC 1.1324]|uniref:efflux RND transporter periplasmic adaptor subunit n=1 Tax=Vitiosangium sp. (strain GDMCC 1.1324) TaxID=2138576 RepID=UPI00130D4DBC|nr:efflux RND transporter periplasmic adaptor subunit [Vitiosangium sp. GDMCC 1.1324]